MYIPQREAIVNALGIETLPLSLQDEIIGDAGQLIFTDILLEILEKLPPAAAETFKNLTEEGKGEEAEKLAASHIDNLPVLVADVAQKSLARIKGGYAAAEEK